MDASYDRCMYCRGECCARAVGTCDRYGKRSALTRTAEALPWIGNVMGGMAEVTMGTIV